MALITSPTETIPDLNYEYHTLTIDSIGQPSANAFTCFLQQPLKNVVQARLLAARINSNVTTEHCYISIKELDSIFNDRASNVYEGQSSMSMLRNSFASVLTEGEPTITFKDNYPVVTQYIDPIRRVDRLTLTIRDQDGNGIVPSTPAKDNFLILRFVCRKPNL
jgi:hypothetical protein